MIRYVDKTSRIVYHIFTDTETLVVPFFFSVPFIRFSVVFLHTEKMSRDSLRRDRILKAKVVLVHTMKAYRGLKI